MMQSKEYWKGYNDAQKQAERNWERARIELNGRFINVLESLKDVKGVGPKLHLAIVEHGMEQMMNPEKVAQVDRSEITGNERSRIIKELANTKWSSLDNDQLIALQNILTLNVK
jgi:predicted flap endonuclease-1-like 5' DNA nuclease